MIDTFPRLPRLLRLVPLSTASSGIETHSGQGRGHPIAEATFVDDHRETHPRAVLAPLDIRDGETSPSSVREVKGDVEGGITVAR
jgi:hypothetical protein